MLGLLYFHIILYFYSIFPMIIIKLKILFYSLFFDIISAVKWIYTRKVMAG